MRPGGGPRRSTTTAPGVCHANNQDGGGEGLLRGLLAPLRLPERVVLAIEASAEALDQIPPMRAEIVRIREQSEPLDKLLPTLENMKQELRDSLHDAAIKLERIESHLDDSVAGLVQEMAAMHGTVSRLQDDVERITDRLPDQDAPGPLERARDALTGGD